MKRYLPSVRSRSNTTSTSALGDQFIREFTAQAKAIMQELSTQFSDNLQAQASQALQSQFGSNLAEGTSDFADGAMSGDGSGTSGGLGQLLNTGVRYLVSRPQISYSAAETSRSMDAARLSVSSSQAAAEAQLALNKGSKNL